MIRVIIELLALYLIYVLIFDFIIPIYRTTGQVKKKVNEMQEKMNNQQSNFQGEPNKSASNKPPKEDYIDYEEVK